MVVGIAQVDFRAPLQAWLCVAEHAEVFELNFVKLEELVYKFEVHDQAVPP